jgi:hypothetical protein
MAHASAALTAALGRALTRPDEEGPGPDFRQRVCDLSG